MYRSTAVHGEGGGGGGGGVLMEPPFKKLVLLRHVKINLYWVYIAPQDDTASPLYVRGLIGLFITKTTFRFKEV